MKGFTLIEVLVALVILSIALTTVIKTTSQTIKSTIYLQNKTVASWVATEMMNEAKMNLLSLPQAPDRLNETKTVLDLTVSCEAFLSKTPNPFISEIHVNVKRASDGVMLFEQIGYKMT